MFRKLIQLSPSTSVVSMPSQWIKTNQLRKGDEIFVEENENKIIISPTQTKTKKETTIDVTNLPDKLIWVTINAVYIAGYDSIIIKTKDQEQTFFMNKVVQYFPGMIIYDERKNMVQFKAVDEGENTTIDFNKLLNRLFHLNVALFEDAIQAMQLQDWQMLIDAKRRDYVINSHVAYYFRYLNKSSRILISKIGTMHTYVKILEMFSDQLCNLFMIIGQKKLKVKNEIGVILELSNVYKSLQKLHFEFSQEKLNVFETSRLKFAASLQKLNAHLKTPLVELSDMLFDLEELETEAHLA